MSALRSPTGQPVSSHSRSKPAYEQPVRYGDRALLRGADSLAALVERRAITKAVGARLSTTTMCRLPARWSFSALPVAQSHPWATAISVDEFDASSFERAANSQVIRNCERSLVVSCFSTENGVPP
jgi:hypothetical protein